MPVNQGVQIGPEGTGPIIDTEKAGVDESGQTVKRQRFTLADIAHSLRQIFYALAKPGWVDQNARMRVNVEAATTLSTTISSGTISTVTNLGASSDPNTMLYPPIRNAAFGALMRSRIF